MPTQVIMPALGMAQEMGKLLAWLKGEGDHVERGEPIMEVETDKATLEVEASSSGTLANITANPGDEVPVGTVIALILAPDEVAPSQHQVPRFEKDGGKPGTPGMAESKSATPVAVRIAQEHNVDLSQVPASGKRVTRADVVAYINGVTPPSPRRLVLASPKARRLADEHEVDLAHIVGSGPEGAVLAADVVEFVSTSADRADDCEIAVEPKPAQVTAQTGQMWRRMAERLTESWQTVPHFYLKREVSAGGLIIWRERILSRSDVPITYTDLLVKLVAAALRRHPHVNGCWREDTVVFNEQVNIGLAVAVEQGLIVPVIHTADTLGVAEIAQRRQKIIERSLQGKLRPDDLQGGTFTISNLGMYGIDEFSAIVNPPEAAILAVGRIVERVVPVDGELRVRSMVTLSLSCDHRAVDGVRGAQFLDTLANLIDDPLRLMD